MHEYWIRPVSPEAHLFEVRLQVRTPDPTGQQLALPAWIPGSYMIRDFARNLVTLTATSGGSPVVVEKLDKQTWRCAPCSVPLLLVYQVYAWELSVRAAHLDTTHGYFNGTSVFLQVCGQEAMPCRVHIASPKGQGYRDWRLATSLRPVDAPFMGFGTYEAESYEALVDYPVEMGKLTLLETEVKGIPHRMAISGKHRADTDRIARDLSAICTEHVEMFGGTLPIDQYLFLVLAVGDGYGGLEHRDSTSLICKRDDLPRHDEGEPGQGYRRFLGLCSHEYFHLWNVKRITPEAFRPYDLSREVHTRLLWAFEGITSYYDELALVRSRCIGVDSYLELLGQTVTRVIRGSGRRKQTLTESSFDAWTKYYKQDENAPNAIVSYYAKGALVALALDLTIRIGTDGARSLDDVMRALWQDYGRTGLGVPEDGVERLAEEASGLDLGDFFQAYVHGTEDPPLERLLAEVGIGLGLRPARSLEDFGGRRKLGDVEPPLRPGLGAQIKVGSHPPEITVVPDASPAQAGGLAPGDQLVAVDGFRATADNLAGLVGRLRPGEQVPIHVFRRDQLHRLSLTARLPSADTCELWLAGKPGEERLARRRAWLKLAD